MLYPEEGTVYSYNLDDAGISSSDSDEALDEEDKGDKKVFYWLSEHLKNLFLINTK